MNCVVCGGEILAGMEQYANTWEKVRKRLPCCGKACVEKFDPQEHWLPWDPSGPLDPAEEVELIEGARQRLRGAESPRANARELLVAGVDPKAVRRLLDDTGGFVAYQKRKDRGAGFSLVAFLFGFLAAKKKTRTVTYDELDGARADVDRWCQHYGLDG